MDLTESLRPPDGAALLQVLGRPGGVDARHPSLSARTTATMSAGSIRRV